MKERSLQIGEVPFSASDREMSRDAYALLAQANLLRMRGNWADAIEKCMAALKLAPEHPSAQSLLGDIYENQGCLDDAIQWYRMALDVQPDSPADKVKLTRLLERKARTAAPVASSPSIVTSDAILNGRRTALETLLRRSAFAAGAGVLLIIFAAILLTRLTPHKAAKPTELNVPTVVIPAVPSFPLDAQSNAAAPAADSAELSLLESLHAPSELANQGISISGVQTDPRAERLTITALCQPVGQAALTRGLILRDALNAIKAAMSISNPRVYAQFTVRCLLSSPGGGSTPLVFTADASRNAVNAENTNLSVLSDEQVLEVFSNPWWSPAVAS